MPEPLKIALVAGEASGDQLGGALIEALKTHFPDARYFGVGGEKMRRAGCDTWWDRRELSVMGLFEVLRHLPRLTKLRKALRTRLLEERPDVFIGIDAPDFNLGLEKSLRREGINTVHYVSPTVWAWRSGRAARIGASANMVLCLFPFEPDFYREHGVKARYTGHPMADAIDSQTDTGPARQALGLGPADAPGDNQSSAEAPVIALLPGSRASEVTRLAEPMLAAARVLAGRPDGARFIAGLADDATAELFRQSLGSAPGLEVEIIVGRALEVMAAADVVIVASGTATLECLLVNRPMVVVYRLANSTYRTAKTFRLVKSRFISLPNILANEALVPELIQDQANGATIALATEDWLSDPERYEHTQKRFATLHRELRKDAAAAAAEAIRELVDDHRSGQ